MFKISNLLGKKSIEKEVKNMKRLIVMALAMALIFSNSGIAFAGFVQDPDPGNPKVLTATVTPTAATGRVVTPFSADLKNIVGDAGATQITWSSVQAKGTDWKSANQYVEVKGFNTHATWGIQIYTDNKNGTPPAKYTEDKNPAGLVITTGTNAGKKVLPMCWRVVADKKFTNGSVNLKIEQKYIAIGPAADSYVLLRQDLPNPTPPDPFLADDDYKTDVFDPTKPDTTGFFAPWNWMLDKNTPDCDSLTPGNQAFGDYQVYATAVGDKGITVAADDYQPIPTISSPYYIYFGAKFINAEAGATYKTTKLTIQKYHLD